MKTQHFFVACPLSKEIREEVTRIRRTLRLLFPHGLIWTDPVDFHITVVFLGELTEAQQGTAGHILTRIIPEFSRQGFAYSLDSLDGFPEATEPRVIMVRVNDRDGIATAMQQRLQAEFVQAGIMVDQRVWQPHITIARNKKNSSLHRVPAIAVHALDWASHSIQLMGTNVKHTGPKYMVVKEYAEKN